MKSDEASIECHRAFLEKDNEEPLIGAIRGWENLSRYVPDTGSFFPKGDVSAEDLSADRFQRLYEAWTTMLNEPDVLFRTLEPLPFFPWAEAAMGCRVVYTGKNFWSSPPDGPVDDQTGDPWLKRYGELLDFLAERFGGEYPIGQPILRGPLDLAAAVFGEEQMIYRLYDHPEEMKAFLKRAADVFLRFVQVQHERSPVFLGGSVVGSYYIWTPGSCIRLQEDAMALLSPDLYREFGHPVDCRIAEAAEYTLFHMHATVLHLLDVLLENTGLQIIQVSKDEGVGLGAILESLKTIQSAGFCLIVKGRFSNEEVRVLKSELVGRGLCIQGVVLTEKETDDFYAYFQAK